LGGERAEGASDKQPRPYRNAHYAGITAFRFAGYRRVMFR
jgi:hypothetical protein